jgi:hypothetical protein
MTQQDADTEDGIATTAWRQRLAKWRKLVVIVSLVVFLIGATTLPSTAVSSTEPETDGGNAGTSSDNEGLFGGIRTTVDWVWCWAFGCSEPVVVSQTETVVIEESAPTQQADTPDDLPNTTVDAKANATTNTTIEASGSGSGSVRETVSDTPVGEGSKTVEGGGVGQRPATSPRIVQVVSSGETATAPWWWFLLIALFAFISLALIGLALYRHLGQTDRTTGSAPYPTTLRPRVVRAKPRYTDGGTKTTSAEAASSSEPPCVRLTEARTALDNGQTDQSVTLAVQALVDACVQEEEIQDHAALFTAWESTAAELPTLPATLDQLHEDYEQAIFSPQSVSETDAMTYIETVEALLTASDT